MARGRIRSLRAVLLAFPLALAIAQAAQAAPPSQSPTRALCPTTFQVLHNDRIGTLRLRAGAYQITVANPARVSCAKATQDLGEFLQDYDGRLRSPWTVNAPQATFQRDADATTAFSIVRTGNASANGGMGNPTANACPGFFRVLGNDHIGSLPLGKGAYRITLLNPKALSCAAAARQLTSFLRDFDGLLSKPWVLNAASATFTRGKGSSTGFRVKPAVGPEPKPGSGARYPAKGQPGECPGTFRVLHRDRINNLKLPAAPYLTYVAKGSGLSCSQLSRILRQFLARGDTPRGYSVNVSTGTFLNRGTPIFRIKPASPRASTFKH
jgi:hypothetical protein